MNDDRINEIAILVLATLSPKSEAVHPVRGLQRKLRQLCGPVLPEQFINKLLGIGIPPLRACFDSGLITADEARIFAGRVFGEIENITITEAAARATF